MLEGDKLTEVVELFILSIDELVIGRIINKLVFNYLLR